MYTGTLYNDRITINKGIHSRELPSRYTQDCHGHTTRNSTTPTLQVFYLGNSATPALQVFYLGNSTTPALQLLYVRNSTTSALQVL